MSQEDYDHRYADGRAAQRTMSEVEITALRERLGIWMSIAADRMETINSYRRSWPSSDAVPF
jgi:hypothetical protein